MGVVSPGVSSSDINRGGNMVVSWGLYSLSPTKKSYSEGVKAIVKELFSFSTDSLFIFMSMEQFLNSY